MLNLLFPRVCEGCKEMLSKGQRFLCVECRHRIPLTNFHNLNSDFLKNKLYGRIPVENATALMQFQKGGLTQELMHSLKYRGQKELSAFFGQWLGAELCEVTEYQKVTVVIPVPLHKQKLKKRGYNQVEGFGKELAKALNVDYCDDILVKISKTSSQVFKSRVLRFEAEEMFFNQKIDNVNNQHILLVDDIITTGATLEKCATQLLKGENVKISIATIATS